ncbi:hypothetical protein O6H91_07G014500 [Diphasiastrum complanatum]|uniref:Uncharacterized protein n=1 Tax=Diphasiastrum complanatum TaxID=34168 RepID=A0ACC2D2R5_DIPCM|nr:hypothetical protein O6H91_07G014500 [Diphasiastrum complanatum]
MVATTMSIANWKLGRFTSSIFSFLINDCVLILLVFRNKIIHIALSFSKLHLVHAFICVLVQEGLSSEHNSELLTNSFKVSPWMDVEFQGWYIGSWMVSILAVSTCKKYRTVMGMGCTR